MRREDVLTVTKYGLIQSDVSGFNTVLTKVGI